MPAICHPLRFSSSGAVGLANFANVSDSAAIMPTISPNTTYSTGTTRVITQNDLLVRSVMTSFFIISLSFDMRIQFGMRYPFAEPGYGD